MLEADDKKTKEYFMKKFAISLLTAGLLISSGLQAQENAGGAGSSSFSQGGLNKQTIFVGVVAAGIVASAIANSNGSTTTKPIDELEPTCNGTDDLVDGVCIGTTTTVTLSGTTTISVPVTFTYAPTLM